MPSIRMSAEDKRREQQWKIESAMRTINEYNNIMKDKGLINQVKKATEQQLKMLGGSVAKKTKK
jgi:capsular polysaccharide biosynthesis protein